MKKKILFLTAQLPQLRKTVQQKRKAHLKKVQKNSSEKSSGTRTVSESAKSNAGAAGQGTTQTPVASVPADGYKDGTYEGSGTGFGGTIRVRVTISGGKIAAIDILEASGETASYFASAQGVISRMIAGNTPNVDAVSGATYSSNGIIQAVQNALSQAAADGNSQQVTPTPAATALPTPTSAPSPTKNHLLQRNRKIRTVPKNIWMVNIQLRQRASMET